MVAADRDSACGGVVQRVGHVRIGERERESRLCCDEENGTQ